MAETLDAAPAARWAMFGPVGRLIFGHVSML
jgi:hypothetical protein